MKPTSALCCLAFLLALPLAGEATARGRDGAPEAGALEAGVREGAGLDALGQSFDCPAMRKLVAQALLANKDLQLAVARLDAAKAQQKAARAPLLPSFSLSANASRVNALTSTAGSLLVNDYAQAALSYEPDIFGAIRKAGRAAGARTASAAYQVKAVQLAVATQAMQYYVIVAAYDAQLAALKDQFGNIQRLQAIVDHRAAEKEVSAVEIGLVQQQWASIQAEISAVESARQGEVAALAVLVGQDAARFNLPFDPDALRGINGRRIALEQPFELIDQRPDLLAAQQDLAAAKLNVAAVNAGQLPRLRLTPSGILGLASNPISVFASFGALLSANLFEGGAITARKQEAQALARQALLAYDKQRLVAGQEVVSSLAAVKSAQERETYWTSALLALEKGTRAAQSAYLDGDYPFNLVIDSRRNESAGQLARIGATRDRWLAQISTIRALGGGAQWQ